LASTVAPASAASVLGGSGTPEVLADLEMQYESRQVARGEQQLRTERHVLAEQPQRSRDCLRGRANWRRS